MSVINCWCNLLRVFSAWVLKIARAGYYAWLHEPESGRTIEDKRLLQLIHSSYEASYGIYGYRRSTLDRKRPLSYLWEDYHPSR